MHALQRVVVQTEVARHQVLLQHAEDIADVEARRGHRQQREQGARRHVDRAARPARNGVRDVAVARHRAEHGLDQRRRGFEVRRHHQHLRGVQHGAAGDQSQEVVLQHLELARQRVADVDLEAAVGLGQRDRRRGEFGEIEDGVLQPGQQRVDVVAPIVAVIGGASARAVDQSIDMRLGLFAPGCQQPIAFLLMLLAPTQRKMAQAAPVDQLEPVLLARVEDIDVEFEQQAHLLQPRNLRCGHGGQCKDMRR